MGGRVPLIEGFSSPCTNFFALFATHFLLAGLWVCWPWQARPSLRTGFEDVGWMLKSCEVASNSPEQPEHAQAANTLVLAMGGMFAVLAAFTCVALRMTSRVKQQQLEPLVSETDALTELLGLQHEGRRHIFV